MWPAGQSQYRIKQSSAPNEASIQIAVLHSFVKGAMVGTEAALTQEGPPYVRVKTPIKTYSAC
ncbi:hypothetical protein COLO4_00335 [Corchorus olitorius]|uniref:Uncharacterized protein n=1 Tax=Corchorus olitorius TaxID=93759 RepID=A0A1R3L3Z8_9ROSI|nr:hypothetical protein COLO4_02621 [Corchorus olitorius]OMP14075.1 hypothetical protein COLO4_00335 [Corchorus olitorius]